MQPSSDGPIEWLHCGRLLAERSPHAVALVDHPDLHVRYANPAFCRLVGRSCDALVDRVVGRALDLACAREVTALLEKVAARQEGDCLADVESPGPAGVRYRTYRAWPIAGAARRSGLVLEIVDTTEAVLARAREAQAAQDLRDANEHLLVASVRERELAREAQEAVRARDVFLARASHELRTPLTSAYGVVRMLERSLMGMLAEPPEALIRIALRSLEVMTRLVNDLLDASRLATDADTLEIETVVLGPAVERALDVVRAQAREKGLRVAADVPASLAVRADPARLEQLLVNLLANAVTFTPAGGEVDVSAEARVVDAEEAIVLRVRDTGEGIAPEHLQRVFEPFFRVAGVAGERVRGSGLGLAICRRIVTLHGGAVWAESEGPGRGSTFVVTLPADLATDRAA